jgi:hypothetical protein
MRKTLLVLLASTLATVALARPAAAIEVVDPNHLLDQLDQYLGTRSFGDAYRMGDRADYTRLARDCQLSCGADGCGMACTGVTEPMSLEVSQLGADAVTLSHEDGATESLTLADFSAQHGNCVRRDIADLDQRLGVPGYLEASTLADRAYALPSGESLAGKEIVFLYRITGRTDTFKVRYTVVNTVPALGQIAQMAVFGQWWYKLSKVARSAK